MSKLDQNFFDNLANAMEKHAEKYPPKEYQAEIVTGYRDHLDFMDCDIVHYVVEFKKNGRKVIKHITLQGEKDIAMADKIRDNNIKTVKLLEFKSFMDQRKNEYRIIA